MSQSNLSFDPKTGLKAPDTAQVLAEVQAVWQNAFGNDLNIDPATPQGQLITSMAAMIATKNTEILKLAQQFNPFIAQGIWQDALGYIYFLNRKIAQRTVVTCTCRGLVGTVIPAGALVEDINGLRFASSGEFIIPLEEQIDIQFTCTTEGVIPVGANTVNKIITVVAGWDTVENNLAGITGTLTETQGEFEKRRFDSVAKNSHGPVSAIYGNIADLNNVIAVVILENVTNVPKTEAGVIIDGHSVFISVYGGSDADIARAIYNKIDAGCGTTGSTTITHIATDYFNAEYQYNITRPDEIPFYLDIDIRLAPDTPADITTRIKEAVTANFLGNENVENTRVKMAETVYASRFYQSIINAGAKDLLNCKISIDNINFTDFLFINADKIPVISDEYITVNILPLGS